MLTHLQLKQFRNHEVLDLHITSPLLAITGLNGSGKTNILEAIYVSSFVKSFRAHDISLVQHDRYFYTIE